MNEHRATGMIDKRIAHYRRINSTQSAPDTVRVQHNTLYNYEYEYELWWNFILLLLLCTFPIYPMYKHKVRTVYSQTSTDI